MTKHHVSFKHAWDGIVYTFKTQPNFIVHLLVTLVVVVLGFHFQIETWEWLILVFTITLVLIAEMINTSLETMVDLITQKQDLKARNFKDVSAGMVLMASLASLIIGAIIFTPYIKQLLK